MNILSREIPKAKLLSLNLLTRPSSSSSQYHPFHNPIFQIYRSSTSMSSSTAAAVSWRFVLHLRLFDRIRPIEMSHNPHKTAELKKKKLNKNHHYDPNHHLTNTSYHARADSQRFHVRYPATWDATLVLWHRIIVSKLYFHCICVVLPSTFAVTLSVCHFSQFLPSVTFSNSHVQSSCRSKDSTA